MRDECSVLKKYFDARLDTIERVANERFKYTEIAVQKAEIATEKRFESVNEFRKALSDQTNTFITRTEYNIQHQVVLEKLASLIDRFNIATGQDTGRTTNLSLIGNVILGFVAVLALIVSVSSMWLK